MEILEKKTFFSLPDKKIIVRYINRKKGMAADVPNNHVIAGGMLSNAFKRLSAPSIRKGVLVNILTNEEKSHLENLMGIELSIYKNREFWLGRYVNLTKGDNVFDLSDPIQYIDYKILLANTDKIAPSLKDKDKKGTYLFVIVDEEEETQLERDTFNYKKEAFKLYSKIEDNEDILRGIIKILNNKPISDTTKIKWLRSEVEKIVDNDSKKFVGFMKDTNYEYEIFLSLAEDKGIVIQRSNKYSTADGIRLSYEDQLPTRENAVKYLADPKNSELLDILRVKVEKNKK